MISQDSVAPDFLLASNLLYCSDFVTAGYQISQLAFNLLGDLVIHDFVITDPSLLTYIRSWFLKASETQTFGLLLTYTVWFFAIP